MVVLGLAGVAEDERRAEGGVGSAARMSAMRRRKRSPSPQRRMRARQRAGHVLEGEVEVGHAGGEDRLDQLVGRAPTGTGRGAGCGRPRSATARVRAAMGDGGRACRAGGSARAGAVAAVGGEVLGHEHDLAQRRRAVRWRDPRQSASTSARIVVGGPRPLLAPERRDGAEAADAVAPLGHLHVGPRGAGGGPGQVEQVEAAGRRRRRRADCGSPTEGHRDGARGREVGASDEVVAEAGARGRPRAAPRPARRRSARPCSR